MNGLSTIHLELTSRCNKTCFMCGRRKLEREYPELCNWGDMPMEMVNEIAIQVPKEIVIQFHNNGEPLLYPNLGNALSLFPQNIRCLDTNGKFLNDKVDEIIGNLDTITISVIQSDPEGDEQYATVDSFLRKKGIRKPAIIFRLLGNVDQPERWECLSGIIARRILHAPEGSRNYAKPVTIPEIGICLDLLTHLAIDRFGNISICVRFDPEGKLRIGHVNEGIWKAWNSEKRKYYIQKHIEQKRNELEGCNQCHFWGVPIS